MDGWIYASIHLGTTVVQPGTLIGHCFYSQFMTMIGPHVWNVRGNQLTLKKAAKHGDHTRTLEEQIHVCLYIYVFIIPKCL